MSQGRMVERGGPGRRMPGWMLPAGTVLVLLSLTALLTPNHPWVVAGGMVVKLCVEAAAYLWASRREELPVAFRRLLQLFGVISILSVLVTVLQLAAAAGMVTGVDNLIVAYGTVTYLLGFGRLLFYPREPLRRTQLATLVLDLLLVGAPLGLLQWAILTETLPLVHDRLAWINNLSYGATQVAMLCGMSLVVSVGRPIPSRRAFWWLMAALGSYVPTALFGQLGAIVDSPAIRGLSECFFFGGVVALLVAAVCIRSDPFAPPGTLSSPGWLGGINPLSVAMPVAVGVGLLVVLDRGLTRLTLPLAATLVASAGLLVVRLLFSTIETARLQREERRTEERIRTQRELARAEERERMLQDIHDGVGSNLTTAVFQLRGEGLTSAAAADVVQACLDDVRLFVDALSNHDGSLAHALSDLRHRIRERMGASGPLTRWEVAPEGLPTMPGETLLQVMRIVQEALTNVLRHAQAKHVTVGARRTGDELLVEVRDDGIGVSPGGGGRGLKNMRRRAQRIGGTLSIDARSDGPGVEVRLTMPCRAGASEAA